MMKTYIINNVFHLPFFISRQLNIYSKKSTEELCKNISDILEGYDFDVYTRNDILNFRKKMGFVSKINSGTKGDIQIIVKDSSAFLKLRICNSVYTLVFYLVALLFLIIWKDWKVSLLMGSFVFIMFGIPFYSVSLKIVSGLKKCGLSLSRSHEMD